VRGASDKETRSRLPDRPVVLRQWSQPTLGANTKECVRDRPVNLSCLSHPTPPASRAHGDEPTGFNTGIRPARVCALYVSFPFAPLFLPIDNGRIRLYRCGSVPRRCFNSLVRRYARFPRRICRRSICVRISRNGRGIADCFLFYFLFYPNQMRIQCFFQTLELEYLHNALQDLIVKMESMYRRFV